MRINLSIFLVLILFIFNACRTKTESYSIKVSGVKDPIISLNGTWKFSMNPPDKFWEQTDNLTTWEDIQVPGECQMQGFAIKHDYPYVYKHEFIIPEDYNEKQILLNFYGVYSYARVWVNGKFIREHFGGFTKWSCDITEYVSAGEHVELTVEIVDRSDDISYGSGYAKHQIGGILRDVELQALPKLNFNKLHFTTELDEVYTNADLRLDFVLSKLIPAVVKIELFDNDDLLVVSEEMEIASQAGSVVLPVSNPKKWDAEHPNLYKLSVTLVENGIESLQINERIGFREVVVEGNKLLVNGKEVKLRGACRHDIHPTLGRMTTAEYDRLDVLLAKESNMNFLRTSHYPPSEQFLDYCDEFGIYVEDETAVCFVGSHRTEAYRLNGASQNDPDFKERYLSQLKEMVHNHFNHPSVIIWSIGNENSFGDNFVESYKWVKQNDQSRPVIYSYPGQVPDSLKLFDIVSMHYPSWYGKLDQYGLSTLDFSYGSMPMLYDEWAHVACYNNPTLRYDPNVRNFWGESLDKMWTNLFEADGGLGGAIWGMIDETFMLPEDLPGFNEWWGILDPNVIPSTYLGPCIGYGEWGIIDTWRRKKPEFWLTKKAYSPTKIYSKQIFDYQSNRDIEIAVHNRFDHTDFNELKISWNYGDFSGELKGIHLEPHQKGIIVIPGNEWEQGKTINVCFYQNDTMLVDEYNLLLGEKNTDIPDLQNGTLDVFEDSEWISISGKGFGFDVNKNTGLLENLKINGEMLVRSGPYLNLKIPGKHLQYSTITMDDYASNWTCTAVRFENSEGIGTIFTSGTYDSISVDFMIQFDENGVFDIQYTIPKTLEGKRIQELGLKFITAGSFDNLSWDRHSYFTAYPEYHIGKPKGEVDLNHKPDMFYRKRPGHVWELDTKGFYYFGLDTELAYTNIARSLKEHIFTYTLRTNAQSILKVFSKGTQACRYDDIMGSKILIINDLWDYSSLLWGNFMKQIHMEEEFKGQVYMRLSSN